MANCKFPAGIEHVSGTLSKKTIRTADGTITQRVFACMRNGKQRIYFRKDGPRTTPLSEKEKQARKQDKSRTANNAAHATTHNKSVKNDEAIAQNREHRANDNRDKPWH